VWFLTDPIHHHQGLGVVGMWISEFGGFPFIASSFQDDSSLLVCSVNGEILEVEILDLRKIGN
jgi:hypothetical protein